MAYYGILPHRNITWRNLLQPLQLHTMNHYMAHRVLKIATGTAGQKKKKCYYQG